MLAKPRWGLTELTSRIEQYRGLLRVHISYDELTKEIERNDATYCIVRAGVGGHMSVFKPFLKKHGTHDWVPVTGRIGGSRR